MLGLGGRLSLCTPVKPFPLDNLPLTWLPPPAVNNLPPTFGRQKFTGTCKTLQKRRQGCQNAGNTATSSTNGDVTSPQNEVHRTELSACRINYSKPPDTENVDKHFSEMSRRTLLLTERKVFVLIMANVFFVKLHKK